jgi:hypothetical protein
MSEPDNLVDHGKHEKRNIAHRYLDARDGDLTQTRRATFWPPGALVRR